MKIIISPDSYKGTISSVHAANAMAKGLKQIDPTIETICLPVADGGEGTLEAFITATNGQFIETNVLDPLNREIKASYGVLGDRETCVIEMAQASGITLITNEERNPLKATTYGTGQFINEALEKGYRKFIIGIGGSATNDAGIGMLAALGAEFLNESGEILPVEVSSLKNLHSINLTNMNAHIKESTFTIACDVDNPLIGENGATAIFGPQKGVKNNQIAEIDSYIKCFADVVENQFDIRLHDYKGAGAAGGVGGALRAFFPCEFKNGIDVVLEAINFDQHLNEASFVITGEGKSDIQTLSGKAPVGIALKAKQYDIPTYLVSAVIDVSAKPSLEEIFEQVVSVVGEEISDAESYNQPAESIEKRIYKAFQHLKN